MKYSVLVLMVSVTLSQDVNRVSKVKTSSFRGTPCDATEYRGSTGLPNWNNWGEWLSECDSIESAYFDIEFAKIDLNKARKAAEEQRKLDEEFAKLDLDAELDLDAMWDNTVWNEITEIGETIYGEVEQVTSVAGVRGAEAEDEALQYLYYRRSMRRLSDHDISKALGKLMIAREKMDDNHPKAEQIDGYIIQLKNRL